MANESQANEQEIVRENVTYTRGAQRKLREIAAKRFPGRTRMIGVTLEQIIDEAYAREMGKKS